MYPLLHFSIRHTVPPLHLVDVSTPQFPSPTPIQWDSYVAHRLLQYLVDSSSPPYQQATLLGKYYGHLHLQKKNDLQQTKEMDESETLLRTDSVERG